MNPRLETLQKWFYKHNPRQRIYIFLLGAACIYIIFSMFLLRPLSLQQKELRDQIAAADAQQTDIQMRLVALKTNVNNPTFLQMLDEQKNINARIAKVQEKLNALKPHIVTLDDLPKLTKNILNIENNTMALISYEDLPARTWPPEVTDKDKPVPDLSNLIAGVIYENPLQINFQSDYFGAISYIKHIEQLTVELYWDSMSYKVLDYPKAEIAIKFHVLSYQKGG